MKHFFLITLLSSIVANAQVPVLVKDIYTGSGNSNPANLTDVNGTLYFSANDGNAAHGTELWKTNGTNAGTTLVQDIYVGGNSNPSNLTNVNGILYFSATDAAHGIELWKTDGSTTTLVKDINPSTTSSYPHDFVAVGSTLYFVANDGTNGFELWKTDGSNTQMVRDIYTGSNGIIPTYSHTTWLMQINGTLYFAATDGSSGTELWKSDGTASGTSLVKDIYSYATYSSFPNKLTNWNDTLYFWADGSTGYELWKSTGTASGTVKVKEIHIGGSSQGEQSAEDWYSSLNYGTNQLFPFNNSLFFVARDNSNIGWELWKTDGTETGTTLVKDIYLGTQSSEIFDFTAYNNEVYFSATDGNVQPFHGKELWKTDGTETGTFLLKDTRIGQYGSDPKFYTVLNGLLYFAATNGSTYTLWKTDGTEIGTLPVQGVTEVKNLTVSNDVLYFSGYNNDTKQELYKLALNPSAIGKINQSTINIFPNPSNGKFIISSDIIQDGIIEVYNMAGIKVLSQDVLSLTKNSIDISGMTKGVYVIKVKTNNSVSTQRVINE
ncbi:MAG: T9SS type A sorting domain-containing protein [Chitinophagales bacterium]|nr:T9SS type A sorting domain-containing protein [Chitinophagales bacterium]HRN93551.1 T9SS type A sorting domain-containing protein [Chitinophagales bacterium]HRP40014.1 T9SS type A sorting domain-containing protein [Chitinophagales bacterium]